MTTMVGLGGGAALVGEASVAPPPIFSPVKPAPAVTVEFGEHSELGVDVGHCARLLALIATLSSPDREIVLLRMVAGVSIPDIVAALGVTPGVVCRVQRQALSALQPAAIAHGRLPAARQRVVLLPHARTEPY